MRDLRLHVGSAVVAAGLLLGHGTAIAASPEKGKLAFVNHGCWQCHGMVGQGSIATSGGKVLAPNPLPFETFVTFVRTTDRAMPPYREQILSNEDLADIYAYLQSVTAPDPKSIPLLNQ
jgi:ubiquinol-cytochrome c reductase cytochrome c subunit